MEYIAFIFMVKLSKKIGLLYTEDEGITNHEKFWCFADRASQYNLSN